MHFNKIDENGDFTILQVGDMQGCYPLPDQWINALRLSIAMSEPDLIVLTGDNVVNNDYSEGIWHTFDQIIKEFVDKDGNEVDSQSRTLAYEIWTVTTNVADGKIGVRIKESGSSKWEDKSLAYTFTNEFAKADSDVISAKLASESGKTGPVVFTVVTGSEAQYVQLKTDAGSTATVAASKATANDDGTLTFSGKVWFNHTGKNTATVRVLDANGWHDAGTLEYEAE